MMTSFVFTVRTFVKSRLLYVFYLTATLCLFKALTSDAKFNGCDEYTPEFEEEKDSCALLEDEFNNLLTLHNNGLLLKPGPEHYSPRDSDVVGPTGMEEFIRHRDSLLKTRQINVTCKCKSEDVCDCSRLQLTQVPQDLPNSITMLSLAKNVITSLPNCSFCSYNKLTYLDLSGNKLSKLEMGSFWNLVNLKFLNLRNNSIVYLKSAFPKEVFSSLQSLVCLKLNRNTKSSKVIGHYYPGVSLAKLIKLETLYLDGIPDLIFSASFRNLTSLKKLVLAGKYEGYCKIIGLYSNSFKNIAQIQLLNISDCSLMGGKVRETILKPLVHLTNLDVSYNKYFGVQKFVQVLSHARTYNLTRLRMNYIQNRFFSSLTITQSMIQSLPSSLNYLEARGNNFESIQTGTLDLLPENLTYLDMGSNLFLYGFYVGELHTLGNLKVLKLNGDFELSLIPKIQPNTSSNPSINQFYKSLHNTGRGQPFIIRLPPKLLCLEMSNANLKYVLSELNFNESNVLQTLSIASNYFPILNGPIKGLKQLKQLDISYSLVEKIYGVFFKYMNELQELQLTRNLLRHALQNDSHDAFKYLTSLKILDLSNNQISYVNHKIFANQRYLEEIDLSMSEIRMFDINITYLLNLKKLNLSHTELSSLPKEARQHIDFLLTKHTVTVDLSTSPIHCDCENLEFLQWMTSSRAFDPNFTYYKCLYDDANLKYIQDSYQGTLRFLHFKCADNSVIFLVVVAATLCMLTFVVAAVLYRFRWKIRYMYHAAYLVFKHKKRYDGVEENFHYDVFISYAYQDEEFVLGQILPELTKRDLKVLVHGRDFAVGEFIASNIVTAVKESRKTLVVLTRDLLRSTWCHFELQMANMESVHTGRSVLVFLIKETIPTKEMNF